MKPRLAALAVALLSCAALAHADPASGGDRRQASPVEGAADTEERLDRKKLEQLRTQLLAKYPGEQAAIDETLNGLRGRITPKMAADFEGFIKANEQRKEFLGSNGVPKEGYYDKNVIIRFFKTVFKPEVRQAGLDQIGLVRVAAKKLDETPFERPLRRNQVLGGLVSYLLDDRPRERPGVTPENGGKLDRARDALGVGSARDARDAAAEVAAADPSNSEARSIMAAADYDMKNFALAAQEAREALSLDPNDKTAQAVANLAHESDLRAPKLQAPAREDGAAATAGGYGGYGRREPVSGMSDPSRLQSGEYARQADRSLDLGDNERAIREADRALALDPKNADAYGLKTMAQARAGFHDSALSASELGLALDARNLKVLNGRAAALNRMGRYREALEAAEEALRADPRNAYAHYMRAMAYNGLRDRAKMVDALRQASALDVQYQAAFEIASRAPADKDLAFLFPEESLAAARAVLAAQNAGGKGLRVTWPVIVGAALLLFGLLHLLLSPLTSRLRLGRQGPTLDRQTVTGSLPTPPPMTIGRAGSGTVLGRQYRRLGQIGSSVHGAVYEGLDLALERPVAIRKLRAEMRASDRDRLMTPARAAAALHHAGIASVYAVLEEAEVFYLVSEFAPGRTLRDVLASRGPLPAEEALPMFRMVAAALAYAHGKHAVHGAVRASNVMISPEGLPKLMDFGLARGPVATSNDLQAFAACLRETIAGLAPAQLDAVDAALARSRGAFGSATEIAAIVSGALESFRDA
jgi:tetratricopeptide (TPR) repeat protein/tRNA A-37 threonylcarbamoyl transferase component Bud32